MATKDKSKVTKLFPPKETKKKVDKKATKKPKKKAAEKKEKATLTNRDEFEVVPHTGREKFADLRKLVLEARDKINVTRWDLSRALYEINKEEMHLHWGYPDWESYVRQEVGINIRTSQYYMKIYQYFDIDIDQDKPLPKAEKGKIVDAVKKLKWTKSKCLVDVATKDNVWDWIDKANTLDGSELERQTRMALNKAKGYDTKVETMVTTSFRHMKTDKDIVDDACEMAGEILESDKRGYQIAMVCQDFVATNMAKKDSGQGRKGVYFNKVGAQFGVLLIAVDRGTGEVVHNSKVFDQVREKMKLKKEKDANEKK